MEVETGCLLISKEKLTARCILTLYRNEQAFINDKKQLEISLHKQHQINSINMLIKERNFKIIKENMFTVYLMCDDQNSIDEFNCEGLFSKQGKY